MKHAAVNHHRPFIEICDLYMCVCVYIYAYIYTYINYSDRMICIRIFIHYLRVIVNMETLKKMHFSVYIITYSNQ